MHWMKMMPCSAVINTYLASCIIDGYISSLEDMEYHSFDTVLQAELDLKISW